MNAHSLDAAPAETTLDPRHGEGALEHAERLAALFRGAETHHGTYDHTKVKKSGDGQKVEPVRMRVEHHPPTVELWRAHIGGSYPLAVSPVRADSTCVWGAIDIDDYDCDHADLVDKVQRRKLPLLVCKSKSGGAHLFFFADAPISATMMQAAARCMARKLDLPEETEVFPKNLAPNNAGCVNMPYFAGDDADRYCVKPRGNGMALIEFLIAAEQLRQSEENLRGFTEGGQASKNETRAKRPGRPPVGKPRGTNGEVTTEAIMAHIEQMLQRMETPGRRNEELNKIAFTAGLLHRDHHVEEQKLKASVLKKWLALGKELPEFDNTWGSGFVSGKQSDKPEIEVGGNDRYPSIERIVHIKGTEPKEVRITLRGLSPIMTQADRFFDYRKFQLECYSQQAAVFNDMKSDEWKNCIRSVETEYEEAPVDETPDGQLDQLVRKFIMQRHIGITESDILTSRPYIDDAKQRVVFAFADLQVFIKRNHVQGGFSSKRIGQFLEKNKCGRTTMNIKGKKVEVRYLPLSGWLETIEPLDLPPLPKEPV